MNINGSKNRGMLLETILNQSNFYYLKNNICLVHKKNLDIKFKSVSKSNNKENLVSDGKIISKSTVDYYGLWNGKFLAFEAKSTEDKTFSLNNIKSHQIEYLDLVTKFDGIAFYIFYFKIQNEFILIMHKDFIKKIKNKKSLQYEEALEIGHKLVRIYPGILDYISVLNNLEKSN